MYACIFFPIVIYSSLYTFVKFISTIDVQDYLFIIVIIYSRNLDICCSLLLSEESAWLQSDSTQIALYVQNNT